MLPVTGPGGQSAHGRLRRVVPVRLFARRRSDSEVSHHGLPLAPEAAEITTISQGVGQAYIQDRNKLKFYPGNALSV